MYQASRGKEFPGTYNYVLLAELFHEQSPRWLGIAEEHLQTVGNTVRAFVEDAIYHTSSDPNVSGELMELLLASLQENLDHAAEELQKLWQDEQHHPITYNHYFTDNIQKARQQSTHDSVKRAVIETRDQDWHGKLHISNIREDIDLSWPAAPGPSEHDRAGLLRGSLRTPGLL